MNMPDGTPEGGRHKSEVLEAIFDAVEDAPKESAGTGSHLFRAKALAQLDIPKQIDNLLPVTSRRLWLAIAGVAVAIIAGLVYAGGTTVTASVSAAGRAIASPGLENATSPTEVLVEQVLVAPGTPVNSGQKVLAATDAAGAPASVHSLIDGTVWQVFVAPGVSLPRGESAVTILPDGSDNSLLVPLLESEAAVVSVGQSAEIATGEGVFKGVVSDIAPAPMPGSVLGARTGLPLDPLATYINVAITTKSAITPGTEASVEIIQSQESLLLKIVGQG
ncbi:MAG: hypothetical protein WBJ33_06810 [Candidatus Nanopelagicales bacterium]